MAPRTMAVDHGDAPLAVAAAPRSAEAMPCPISTRMERARIAGRPNIGVKVSELGKIPAIAKVFVTDKLRCPFLFSPERRFGAGTSC